MIFQCSKCKGAMDFSILEKIERYVYRKECLNSNCNNMETVVQYYADEKLRKEISSSI